MDRKLYNLKMVKMKTNHHIMAVIALHLPANKTIKLRLMHRIWQWVMETTNSMTMISMLIMEPVARKKRIIWGTMMGIEMEEHHVGKMMMKMHKRLLQAIWVMFQRLLLCSSVDTMERTCGHSSTMLFQIMEE
jgi:hypothetical protein